MAACSSARFGPPKRRVDSSSPPKKVLHLLKTSGRLITSLNGTQRRPSVITATKPLRRNSATSSPRQKTPTSKTFTFDDSEVLPQPPSAPPSRRRSTISRQSSTTHKAQQVELRHLQRVFNHWKCLYHKEASHSPFLVMSSSSASSSFRNVDPPPPPDEPVGAGRLSRIWYLRDEPRVKYSPRQIQWIYSSFHQWRRRALFLSSSRLIAIDHYARSVCHGAIHSWIQYIQYNRAVPIAMAVVAKARCKQVQLFYALRRWYRYCDEEARRYDRKKKDQHHLYVQLAVQYCVWRGWNMLLQQLQQRYQAKHFEQQVVVGGIPLYRGVRRWSGRAKQTYDQTSKMFRAALLHCTSMQVKCLLRLLDKIEQNKIRRLRYKRAYRHLLKKSIGTWLKHHRCKTYFARRRNFALCAHIANHNFSHQHPQTVTLTRLVARLSTCLHEWRKYSERCVVHRQALTDSDEIYGYVALQTCLKKWVKHNARYRRTIDKFRHADIVVFVLNPSLSWSRRYLSKILRSLHRLAKTMHYQHLVYRRACRFASYRSLRRRRVWFQHWYKWVLRRQILKIDCLKTSYPSTISAHNVLSMSDMASSTPTSQSSKRSLNTGTQTHSTFALRSQISSLHQRSASSLLDMASSTPTRQSSKRSLNNGTQTHSTFALRSQISSLHQRSASLSDDSPLTQNHSTTPISSSQITYASRESQTDIEFEVSPLTPTSSDVSTHQLYSPINALILDDIGIHPSQKAPSRVPQSLYALYSRQLCATHFTAWKTLHTELLQLPLIFEEENEIAVKHHLHRHLQLFMRRLVSFSVTSQMLYIADVHYIKSKAVVMLYHWRNVSKMRRRHMQESLGKPPLGRPPLPREVPEIARSNLL